MKIFCCDTGMASGGLSHDNRCSNYTGVPYQGAGQQDAEGLDPVNIGIRPTRYPWEQRLWQGAVAMGATPKDIAWLIEAASLRDKFAMAALNGFGFQVWDDADTTYEDWAVRAYEIADAMMAARKPKEEK
jgi:hypothetical protein